MTFIDPLEGQFQLKKELENKFNLDKANVYEFDDKISIDLLVVKDKNSGTGTSVMGYILKYADKKHKTIILSPTDEFGSSKSRLIKFYKRFGFVENSGKNKIFETMYRLPQ